MLENSINYKFLVVIAKPPKDKELIIDNLEKLLTVHLMEIPPKELEVTSTHTRVEEVSGIEIDQISINDGGIFVTGDAVLSVQLQYGSDTDQYSKEGAIIYDSFPFEFEVNLEYDKKHELRISHLEVLDIDTSSLY